MYTTCCANGPGSGASTVNVGAGSFARIMRALPHASFHVRNVLNEARTSSVKIFGCSHAAKWQPLGVRP